MEGSITSKNSLYKIMVEPLTVFRYLNNNPNILIPLFLLIISGILSAVVFHKYLLQDILDFFEINYSLTTTLVVLLVFAVGIISFLITEWMVLSILIYFFTIIFSLNVVKLKNIFCITGYSWIPILIKTFSYLLLAWINKDIFVPQGLTVILGEIDSELIKGILQSLDIFTIWQFVIIGIGIYVITNKKKIAAAIVFTTFLLTVLIKVFPLLLATTFIS